MCGLAGGAVTLKTVQDTLPLIRHRGPDDSGTAQRGPFTLGHTRLAIQDTQGAPRQPVELSHTTITFNGEMWHPQQVRNLTTRTQWNSHGDTEALAAAINEHGGGVLPELGGMFAIAWADDTHLHLTRDPYGEIPLHYGWTRNKQFVYASEIGPLLTLGADPSTITWVPPGHTISVNTAGTITQHRWYTPTPVDPDRTLRDLLNQATRNRAISDTPVAVLASGGLDSTAIITSLQTHIPNLTAYTAVGDPKSADLRHARIVCADLNIPLTEVPVPPPTAKDLARIVGIIEMPHKAQVEIGWACDHLGAAIRADGIHVILTGEGSDELWASYGMSYHGIKAKGWTRYRTETFTGQHRKNFPRTNKVFMRHSIEARLPFLEPALVTWALALTQNQVTHNGRHLKAVLAAAYPEIPHSTAWRGKVAFQTGQRIDSAAAAAVADPKRFYSTQFRTQFRGVTP